jgi:serine protease
MRIGFRQYIFKLVLAVGLVSLLQPGIWIQASAKDTSQPVLDPPGNLTDQIIIRFKNASQGFITPAASGLITRMAQTTGVDLEYVRSLSDEADVFKLPERIPMDQVQKIADLLSALPDVEYAEPDQIRYPALAPNDTYYSTYQWDLFDNSSISINVQPAWDITTGSSSIVVAIGDTGLTNHADLAGRMVSGTVAGSGYDFINTLSVANDGDLRDPDPSDPGDWLAANECYAGSPAGDSSWHGTHVAGTIGAASNNSQGVAGINWNS